MALASSSLTLSARKQVATNLCVTHAHEPSEACHMLLQRDLGARGGLWRKEKGAREKQARQTEEREKHADEKDARDKDTRKKETCRK